MSSALRPVSGLLFLLVVHTLCGQQHAFRQYTPQDGLAQSQVRTIVQDGEGYLWFGTLGGASRYDGHEFVNYALQEGLPDAQINAMTVDGQGRTWVGSGSALVRLQGRTPSVEPLPTQAEGARIMALATGSDGMIYIGTDGGGLYVRDNSGIRRVKGYPSDTAANIRALRTLSDGRLLVGLRNGVLVGRPGAFTTVPLEGPGTKTISALAESKDGVWWIGTIGEGLYRVAPNGSLTAYDEEDGLLLNTVRCLLIDDGGRLWIGGKLGLNVLERNGRMRVFTIHQGMPNDNITCAFEDSEGNLWFGTDGAGALRYAGDRFVTFTVKDGLCSDLVMNITADKQGDIWLGTYDNGICRLDGMATINTLDGLPNNTIWSGLCDRQGTLWFGTSDGLARIDRGQVVPLPPSASLLGNRIMALCEGRSGVIWCGMRDGLAAVKPGGEVDLIPAAANGPGRQIRSILEDDEGVLWLGTEQGLQRYDGRTFKTFTMADGLCDNTVRCLATDDRDRLWIGTSNGLSCYDGRTFTTIRPAEDFGSGFIGLLLVDERGHLWAGTNNGLYVLEPDEALEAGTSLVHFTMNDGLRSLEFNQNAAFRDGRGRLFMGSAGGLMFHDAERHQGMPEAKAPHVYITRLRSFLQRTDWKGRCDSVDRSGMPMGLHLPFRRNHLTFDHTAIALGAPERVVYRYRLRDVDADWLPPTDARMATYSNLPQGRYTYEVKAAVGDGPWSDPASFSFTVDPPFWLRWWFFTLCSMMLAGAVFSVARFRAVRRERREHTRQLLLRSRMLQLEQQALNANMNRHFVFNALNSIQYHINKQDRATASRYLTSFAKLIRKNLDASQNDTTTLAEELERLELYLMLEHMRFKDKFTYAITVEPGVDARHIRLPAMMLQPYVENSIWHGILPMHRPGHVSITARSVDGDRCSIRIEDDGIGVERSRTEKKDVESDHISRGIEITKGRADVLRRLDITDIRIQGPNQQHDPATGEVTGTWVVIELPGHGS